MTDEQLREAVARLYEDRCGVRDFWLADAAIALMRPVIRAQALEEAADAVGEIGDHADVGAYINAIRALKEKPNG